MAAVGKLFKLSADELERLLPAAAFRLDNVDLDSAIVAVANVLGNDGYEPGEMMEGLRRLISKSNISEPIGAVRNIRRWALEGLMDRDLLSNLSHLRSPSIEDTSFAVAQRSKSHRSITAKQARSVLSNAFLGNCVDVMTPYKDHLNRGGLDFREMLKPNDYETEGLPKMECLLTYFEACGDLENDDDEGRHIVFERVQFKQLSGDSFSSLSLAKSNEFVGKGVVLHRNTMESPTRQASGFVNFANPNFGYGKFIPSCTQEEILLMCCPEVIVGMLFIGKMGDDEVVNIHGARRFCHYSGYLDSFKCEGRFTNKEAEIQTVLTLDACYRSHFSTAMLWRDLSKAFFSFSELAREENSRHPVVSTGKWGCGAFGGLPAHKMLQQALAATLAGVDLEFSSFGSMDDCDKVLAALHECKPTPATVMSLLQSCKMRSSFVTDAISFLREQNKAQAVDQADDQGGRNYCNFV